MQEAPSPASAVAVAVTHAGSANGHQRLPNTLLVPKRYFTRSMPLEAAIIGSELEKPVRQRSRNTGGELRLQAFAIGAIEFDF